MRRRGGDETADEDEDVRERRDDAQGGSDGWRTGDEWIGARGRRNAADVTEDSALESNGPLPCGEDPPLVRAHIPTRVAFPGLTKTLNKGIEATQAARLRQDWQPGTRSSS